MVIKTFDVVDTFDIGYGIMGGEGCHGLQRRD